MPTMLKPEEIAIFIALMEQDYVVSNSNTKGWSKDFMMKASGLSRRKFDKASESLVKKGLLQIKYQEITGKKNEYVLVKPSTEIALNLLDETNNKVALKKFFDALFKSNKTPLDITEEDIHNIIQTRIKWKGGYSEEYNRSDESETKMNQLCDNSSKSETVLNKDSNKTNIDTGSEIKMNQQIADFIPVMIETMTKMSTQMENITKSLSIMNTRLDKLEDDVEVLKKQVQNVPAFSKSGYKTYTSIDNTNRYNNINNNIYNNNIYNNRYNNIKNYIIFVENNYIKGERLKNGFRTDLTLFGSSKKDYFNFDAGSITYQCYNNSPLPSIEKNKNKTELSEDKENIKQDFPENKYKQTMSILNNEKYSREVIALIEYFSERYPHNSAEYTEKAIEFFDELKDEWWSIFPELFKLSFRDVFRHFVFKDDKVFIYYEKVAENETELSNKELNDFNEMSIKNTLPESLITSPDKTKIEYIEQKIDLAFDEGEYISLTSLNSFVLGCLRDLNTPMIQDIKYNNERLSPMLISNIEPADEDDQFHWVKKDISDASRNKCEVKGVVNFNVLNSGIRTETKESDLPFDDCATDDENIYVDLLTAFRITKRMDVSNTKDMFLAMCQFLNLADGREFSGYELANLIVAMSVKLNTTPEYVYSECTCFFEKDNESQYILQY